MRHNEYFSANNKFRFIADVRAGSAPWSAVAGIRGIIEKFLAPLPESGLDRLEGNARLDTVTAPDGNARETALSITRSFVTASPIHVKTAKIYVGAGTFLEFGAIIKGSCVIGENSEARQGAYIRGDVIVGDNSVVGHVTEVKNSIFMDHAHAGHFAYVGDSILGNHVNLGAGTILANLQFRSRAELDAGNINEIVIATGANSVSTGLSKLGAVIGDYTEIGCNTVTAPGTMVKSGCWIYPNTTVPKGYHGPNAVIRGKNAGVAETIRAP
jgi:UDP-3-O-[3-hydroxymyristoyl] glucosamine N-acyltransferase